MRLTLSLLTLACAASALAQAPFDTVLMVAGTELANGGNSMVYYTIYNRRIELRAGDRLEYDLFISPDSPEIVGGVDAELDEAPPLRDRGILDQNGVDMHPKYPVPQARGKWLHRVLPLDSVAGRTAVPWSLVMEGDKPGDYAFFVGSIGVHHADGSWTWIYREGPPPAGAGVRGLVGYSRRVIVQPVLRALVTDGVNIKPLVADQIGNYSRQADIRQVQHDTQLVRAMADLETDARLRSAAVDAASAALEALRGNAPLSAQELQSRIDAAHKALAKAKPLMRTYTGHLVGHGHIDPAWQWEWPEGLDVTDKTFAQAVRFMDEYPGFVFSQSSAGLYRLVQQHDPALFKRIQAKAKSGQWDVVGGRVTEADTWMISGESHARNFLLAQRYFRKWFGKTATVGFEPDTFGHTWSMPQILRLGGILDYYFGRGGQGKPLFWWEGPDGSRVLAFDEVASGSWYDSGLDNKVLDELAPWKQATGTNDIMWVYGVGNHGGGPTREQLNTAEQWKKTPFYPVVRYSTAAGFFDAERKQDLSAIPVVKQALDPNIDGCYTTHAEMKRLNRDAENGTSTAEAAAAIAGLYGNPYPKDRFDEAWWGIAFNQHHDTLPGTGTHEVYQESVEQLSAIVAESRNIAGASARFLASLVTRPKDADQAIMVFNPLGWARDGEVSFPWPGPLSGAWMAVSPSGIISLVSIRSGERRGNPTGEPMASFTARAVPGFGYSVYAIRSLQQEASNYGVVQLREEAGTLVVNNGYREITIRKDNGLITSLRDVPRNREMLPPGGAANRLEVWYEDPGPGDAWVIRGYTGHEALDGPTTVQVLTNDRARCVIEVTRQYRHSTITQQIVMNAGSDQVDLPMWIDWQEEGTRTEPTPFLKLACDVAGAAPAFRYEIPFATEQHARDGVEVAALKSADLSGPDGGITLLNDCKSGYSAEGNTLRLSLIRTPNRLDSRSDMRAHFVRASLLPHTGAYGAAQVRRGFDFNQPFVAARVSPSASGRLPVEKAFMTVSGAGIVAPTLKRAEDDPNGLVVRLYETEGKPVIASVSSDIPLSGTQWVNFVEDPQAPKQGPGPVKAELHKYEIRTLILHTSLP